MIKVEFVQFLETIHMTEINFMHNINNLLVELTKKPEVRPG